MELQEGHSSLEPPHHLINATTLWLVHELLHCTDVATTLYPERLYEMQLHKGQGKMFLAMKRILVRIQGECCNGAHHRHRNRHKSCGEDVMKILQDSPSVLYNVPRLAKNILTCYSSHCTISHILFKRINYSL